LQFVLLSRGETHSRESFECIVAWDPELFVFQTHQSTNYLQSSFEVVKSTIDRDLALSPDGLNLQSSCKFQLELENILVCQRILPHPTYIDANDWCSSIYCRNNNVIEGMERAEEEEGGYISVSR
jgi:hypothetical protein